jgi:hypothetical protein
MGSADRPDFDAFVSYSHADKKVARRIQRFLEHHPLPTKPGAAPRRLRVFRDDTDIRAAALTQELGAALARSSALVLCASPDAVRSTWVQQELDLFLEQDRTRPALPVLVAGNAATALPARLAGADIRHVDARGAWRFGFLRRSARDELLRVVAALAGEDLRTFIPWDRRRRRNLAAACAAVVAALAAAALFVPFDYTRALGTSAAVAADSTLEYCDVVEDRIVLVGREGYGRGTIEAPVDVGYACVYPDALGAPARRAWLDESRYLPADRLFHVSVSPRVRSFAEGFDIARLRALALEHLSEPAAPARANRAAAEPLEGGFWAAEPAPHVRIALVAIKPVAFDPAAIDGPPQGASLVEVRDGNATPVDALLTGLSPPSPGTERTAPHPRSADLSTGLPIAVTPREMLIGMPMRPDGAVGGLWRWDRADRTWSRVALRGNGQPTHANVVSLASDPTRPGRMLATTGSGLWSWNARKGEYASEFYERASYDAPWRRIVLLPIESRSAPQLCGFARDGTVHARINQALFARGPYNLFHLLLGGAGAVAHSAPPPCSKRAPTE